MGTLLAILMLSGWVFTAMASNYTATDLFLTVYADGVADVEYKVNLDPTLARATVQVFGLLLNDLLIINQDGSPLTYTINGSVLTIDSLGSTIATISYNTQDLTLKTGSIWSLNITAPTTVNILLPLGSTIISMSDIPLEIGTVDGKPYLSLVEGDVSVSYLLGAVGSKDHAQALIKDAEATISALISNGIKVDLASSILDQAKSAFNSGDYTRAEQFASNAKVTAKNLETQANSADQSINQAATAITTAKAEGRISGITAADNFLKEAQAAYIGGSYSVAQSLAIKAYDAALASKNEGIDTSLMMIAGGIVAVALIGVFVVLRRPKPVAQKPVQMVSEPPVNLEAIFSGNPELRMDDREVIRFLAENRGEAFANEIRDRFGIPRTSAWRMIRRLMGMGIVEEKKIGGQSLIRVTKRWRKAAE